MATGATLFSRPFTRGSSFNMKGVTYERCMLAGSRLQFDVDVGQRAVNEWAANASIPANTLVAPSKSKRTGYVYLTTTEGQTGHNEPGWPTVAGNTATDGSITWTAEIPPANGEDSILSATWTQQSPPDASLTITGETNTSLIASAYFGGGTSGNAYFIVVQITMTSGAIHSAQIVLTTL
jgi:hypothetical protein